MKILMIDAPYDEFLHAIYREDCALENACCEDQLCAVMQRCFGAADFYTHALRKLGHDATDLLWNAVPMQRRWARDNAPALAARFPEGAAWPVLRAWLWEVLEARVEAERPDVLYLQTIYDLPVDMLARMKRYCRLLVGQRAAPIPADYDHSALDLMVSSLPNMVRRFREMALDAVFQPLGFDARVLECVPPQEKCRDVVFVGGLGDAHAERTEFLEAVARRVPIHVWGYGHESLSPQSPLLDNFHGQAWGLDVYRHFRSARVVLNVHSPWAEGYANNLRLFEATGIGTCLLTDSMANLGEYFEPGREVYAYSNADECASLIRYALEHESEREAVAAAGQQRTLRQHTYDAVARLLESVLAERLS